MVGCPQCAVACFSAPVLIDPFASTAPEQAHQSLRVSLPKLQAAGHYQDIACVGTCNSMWTRTHRRNARLPYVVHLTLKSTHSTSCAGITCSFSGTMFFRLVYFFFIWSNWHSKRIWSSSLCSFPLDARLNSKTTLSYCSYSFLSFKSFGLSRERKASRWASDLQRLYEGSLGSLYKSLPALMGAHKGSGYKCLDFWPRHLNILPACRKHTYKHCTISSEQINPANYHTLASKINQSKIETMSQSLWIRMSAVSQRCWWSSAEAAQDTELSGSDG